MIDGYNPWVTSLGVCDLIDRVKITATGFSSAVPTRVYSGKSTRVGAWRWCLTGQPRSPHSRRQCFHDDLRCSRAVAAQIMTCRGTVLCAALSVPLFARSTTTTSPSPGATIDGTVFRHPYSLTDTFTRR